MLVFIQVRPYADKNHLRQKTLHTGNKTGIMLSCILEITMPLATQRLLEPSSQWLQHRRKTELNTTFNPRSDDGNLDAPKPGSILCPGQLEHEESLLVRALRARWWPARFCRQIPLQPISSCPLGLAMAWAGRYLAAGALLEPQQSVMVDTHATTSMPQLHSCWLS